MTRPHKIGCLNWRRQREAGWQNGEETAPHRWMGAAEPGFMSRIRLATLAGAWRHDKHGHARDDRWLLHDAGRRTIELDEAKGAGSEEEVLGESMARQG